MENQEKKSKEELGFEHLSKDFDLSFNEFAGFDPGKNRYNSRSDEKVFFDPSFKQDEDMGFLSNLSDSDIKFDRNGFLNENTMDNMAKNRRYGTAYEQAQALKAIFSEENMVFEEALVNEDKKEKSSEFRVEVSELFEKESKIPVMQQPRSDYRKYETGSIYGVANQMADNKILVADDVVEVPIMIDRENKIVEKEPEKVKKKMPFWLKSSIIAFIVTMCIGVPVLVAFAFSQNLNITDWKDTKEQEESFDVLDDDENSGNEVVFKESETKWDTVKGSSTYDENVINILMIGADGSSKSTFRGNSDTIMIASINKTEKSIKLTSILRDTYVQIPGHRDNKINSAYATGGVPLVKSTIEEDFHITIDGAIVVHFDTFAKLIDKLGGIKAPINEREAAFINKKTKYKYPSLSAGSVKLNGNQALWFSRIRKISSDIFGIDDFGRTARQRYVMNQIFQKYKDCSYTQMASLLTSVMGYFEIDSNLSKQMFTLLEMALSFDASELQTFRFPVDGGYTYADVILASGSTMSVVKIDDYYRLNVDRLHMFLYGKTIYGTVFTTPAPTPVPTARIVNSGVNRVVATPYPGTGGN